MNTIFGKIIQGIIPCKKVFENERILAIEDIHPVAPVHILIMPKKEIPSLQQIEPHDLPLIGEIIEVAQKIGDNAPMGAVFKGRHWTGGGPVDAYDAKSDALALLAALGVAANAVQIAPGGPAFLHPGRSATLQFGPKNIVGWFGELHPSALEALDAEGPLVAFEIVLDAIPPAKARPTKAKPKLERSEFMPVSRDLAFVVAESAPAGDILKAALGADRALIAAADVFDVYRGPGVPEGQKSVAIAVTLQPRERTLTDSEIEAAVAKVVAEVGKKTGATLRQ